MFQPLWTMYDFGWQSWGISKVDEVAWKGFDLTWLWRQDALQKLEQKMGSTPTVDLHPSQILLRGSTSFRNPTTWIYIFLQHPGYDQQLIYDGFRGWWTKTPREGVAKGREISVPETVQAEAPSPSCWTWMRGNDSVRRSRWLRGNMHLRKLLSQLHLLFVLWRKKNQHQPHNDVSDVTGPHVHSDSRHPWQCETFWWCLAVGWNNAQCLTSERKTSPKRSGILRWFLLRIQLGRRLFGNM